MATIAQALGVSARKLERATLARITRARSAIAEISLAWSDVDSVVEFEAERLLDQLDAFKTETLAEAMALLSDEDA